MDKLKLQTVYVPVPVPMKQWVKESGVRGAIPVQVLPDRIVLTPGELRDLIAECAEGLIRRGENITIFLKSKGIEL